MTFRPAAVLWDLDGTIVDTEPYWISAEYELMDAYGASWSEEQGLQLVGSDLIDSANAIIAQTGIPLTPEKVVETLVDAVDRQVRESVPWRPGALELLADLRAEGIPCGLVTMSYRQVVEPILAALPAGTFDVVVTGDQVDNGKPHPEPYLTAARQLGVRTEDCVALEDSNTGARSAAAARCRVLVAPLHVEIVPDEAYVMCDGLPASAAGLAALAGR